MQNTPNWMTWPPAWLQEAPSTIQDGSEVPPEPTKMVRQILKSMFKNNMWFWLSHLLMSPMGL
eukprot:6599475-Pyramimonas_sp.AAC.1